jgi:allantoin racemase
VKLKILLVNPNISSSVTDLIRSEAERAALPGTEIATATASFGVAYIETPAEATVGAHAALELLAAHHAGADAAIVAAFGDPGVNAARELLPIPVIGLTEAALATAFLFGGRFAVVGISVRIGAWYRQVIHDLGMSSRFIGFRGLDRQFTSIGNVQHEQRQVLLDLCLSCVEHDQADSIILAGAPLAGLAREIASQVPVPLIDGVGSAVRMAESLARSGYRPRGQGALSLPPAKASAGLGADLGRLIGRT